MTDRELREVVLAEVRRIAPEVDVGALPGTADLREAADLDSMDVLNLLAALGDRLGVQIPARDASRLTTLDGLVSWLGEHGGAQR